ncbi:hypothetical protein ACTQX2_02485 [Megamonas funiformis]|uniref:hypothetical protein n=1 Tax=Megamonas funiformis TaxID=437897 RepID=UPI003F9A357C
MENTNVVANRLMKFFQNMINDANKQAELITGTDAQYKKARIYAELAKAIALTGCISQSNVDNTIEEKKDNVEIKEEAVSKKTSTSKLNKDSLKRKSAVSKVTVEETKENAKNTSKENNVETEEAETIVKTSDIPVAENKNIEEEFTNEWTDAAREYYKDELEFINNLTQSYGEETMNSCVEIYTEGIYKKLSDINPLNIKGYVELMKQLMEDANKADQAAS